MCVCVGCMCAVRYVGVVCYSLRARVAGNNVLWLCVMCVVCAVYALCVVLYACCVLRVVCVCAFRETPLPISTLPVAIAGCLVAVAVLAPPGSWLSVECKSPKPQGASRLAVSQTHSRLSAGQSIAGTGTLALVAAVSVAPAPPRFALIALRMQRLRRPLLVMAMRRRRGR